MLWKTLSETRKYTENNSVNTCITILRKFSELLGEFFQKGQKVPEHNEKMVLSQIPEKHFFDMFSEILGRYREFSIDFRWHIINYLLTEFARSVLQDLGLDILMYEKQTLLINNRDQIHK